jgi:hypothetical protein
MFAQYTEIYLWNFSMWSFVSELVQSLVSGKLFKVHFVIVHLLSYLLCLDLSSLCASYFAFVVSLCASLLWCMVLAGMSLPVTGHLGQKLSMQAYTSLYAL